MDTDLPNLQKQVSKALWFNTPGEPKDTRTTYTYEEASAIDKAYQEIDNNAWKEAKRINYASYKRTNRLKKRNTTILKYGQFKEFYAIFLTLTFEDKVFDKTTSQTRRKYVRRFLKENCIDYVANIDFGGENGREHYHALVLTNHLINNELWKYGIINFKRITKFNKSTDDRIAKYIAKFTNHAIKETCKQHQIMYSRNRKVLCK